MEDEKKTEVEVVQLDNASAIERAAFLKAAEEFEREINDPEFWYDVSLEYPTWLYNNGLSFKDFKALVLSGRDKFETKDDYHIRIGVTYYFSRKRVVGYTYPSTWKTWLNRNVSKYMDIGDIAGNQFHEYLHNLGFDHPNASRASLVYKAGYLLRRRVQARYSQTKVPASGNKPVIYVRPLRQRIRSFFRRLFR